MTVDGLEELVAGRDGLKPAAPAAAGATGSKGLGGAASPPAKAPSSGSATRTLPGSAAGGARAAAPIAAEAPAPPTLAPIPADQLLPCVRITSLAAGGAAPVILAARIDGAVVLALLPADAGFGADATVEVSIDGGQAFTAPLNIKIAKK